MDDKKLNKLSINRQKTQCMHIGVYHIGNMCTERLFKFSIVNMIISHSKTLKGVNPMWCVQAFV